MSPRLRNPEIRWVVLALACTLMASNFYAYDLPASLNTPMQAWLGLSDGDFAYAVNLFYSVYSFPNIVLPFFGGYLIDKFGVRWLMMILSFVQFMGQVVFSLGNDRKSVAVMLLGRLLFGVGGESLAVAQNSVTARYFRGKELALALGLNLAIARLGSVANDLVSPKLAVRFSVSLAVWVGTATCFVALICSIVLGWLDARLTRESEMDAARGAGAGAGAAAPPPNPAHYAQLSDDADKDSDRASELPVEMEEAEGAEPMPSASTSRLSRSTSVRVNLVDESRVHTRHRDHSHDMAEHHGSSDPSSAALLSPPGTELPGSTPRSPALAASRTSFTTIRLPLPSSPIPSGAVHHINRIPNISDFPVSYHLLLIVIVFQYATVVPFGTIHSALLQLKWYPSDPELAGEVMGVPDTISAVMVPFVGTFTDRYGRRSQSLTVCGILMTVAHLLIGLANPPGVISTPIPALILLGLGYGLLGVLWSAVPILVPEETGLQGTAFGIATSVFNFSTFVFPLCIALLINLDPTYLSVQLMFALCCALGAGVSHIIPWYDETGKMDVPESFLGQPEPAPVAPPALPSSRAEPDEIPLVIRNIDGEVEDEAERDYGEEDDLDELEERDLGRPSRDAA